MTPDEAKGTRDAKEPDEAGGTQAGKEAKDPKEGRETGSAGGTKSSKATKTASRSGSSSGQGSSPSSTSRTTESRLNTEQADVMVRCSGRGVGVIVPPRRGPRRVEFSEVNGLAIFEGDIELGEPGELEANERALAAIAGEMHAAVVADNSHLWPGGRVPYEPLADDSPIKEAVQAAMEEISRRTPVRFEAKTNSDVDYIAFEVAPFSSSRVGRSGGRQVVRLHPEASAGTVIHEICHALGLWHEQSREDRDDYIRVVWENVIPGYEHNFRQQVSVSIGPYDFDSIMHYPPDAFSVNGLPTLEARVGNPQFGQRERLSEGDAAALTLLYGPAGSGSGSSPEEPQPESPPGSELGAESGVVEVTANPRDGVQFRVRIPARAVARVVTHDWPADELVHWEVVAVEGPAAAGPLLSWSRSVGRSKTGGVDHYFTIENLSDVPVVAEARYVKVVRS